MKNFAVSLAFASLFGWAFFYSLTTTLDDLTQKDCEAGVEKACSALANNR